MAFCYRGTGTHVQSLLAYVMECQSTSLESVCSQKLELMLRTLQKCWLEEWHLGDHLVEMGTGRGSQGKHTALQQHAVP